MNPAATPLPLRDIHLPEPVSWWPPAPGWWLLAVAIMLLGFGLWIVIRRWQKKRRRRDSLRALADIRAHFAQHHNSAELLREISVLMRRACITFYPRNATASLTGTAWLQFLDSTAPRSASQQKAFVNGWGKMLATTPYLPPGVELEIDSKALLALCEKWLHAQPNKRYATQSRARQNKPAAASP